MVATTLRVLALSRLASLLVVPETTPYSRFVIEPLRPFEMVGSSWLQLALVQEPTPCCSVLWIE